MEVIAVLAKITLDPKRRYAKYLFMLFYLIVVSESRLHFFLKFNDHTIKVQHDHIHINVLYTDIMHFMQDW